MQAVSDFSGVPSVLGALAVLGALVVFLVIMGHYVVVLGFDMLFAFYRELSV